METQDESIILIPSLEPDKKLLSYVQQLHEYGLKQVLIVDDGSGEEYQWIFRDLRDMGCVVLHHEINLGKGAALKTGFQYIEKHMNKGSCIVTADSDGQHAAEDVYRLVNEAARCPHALILGVRDFNSEGIPPKSLLGNRITSLLFYLLYGMRLTDTQTGLRSFGPQLLPFMQGVKGNRFEYELQMLISCMQAGITIQTMPIQVLYHNGNAGTHFKAIRDSARIMSVLFTSFFKFMSSSLTSAVVDIGIAWILLDLFRSMFSEQDYLRILLATVIARVISIGVNYFLNRNFVFHKKNNQGSLWRYLTLCTLVILLSSTGVYLIHTFLPIHDKTAKLICDGLLFVFSYQAQQRWVFAERRTNSSAK